jgi:anti-anti-sigma factor
LDGDLDIATAPALRDALSSLDGTDLVIDCTDLQFLDSTGVALFVHLKTTHEHSGHSVTLRNVNGTPRRTLEILGLLEALDGADHH